MAFDALGRAVARATADASGTAKLALPAGVYIAKERQSDPAPPSGVSH
ncbi:hypothetical protein Q5H93_13110 [Hymenobacter sp. ASUV-10]|uniref:Uncharacterized protein n=1 Tax=Hymenobacter aranciens TaxID=3063996 RepID=A0ABT9BBP3_9BACT|nr:hypothetical protein [Hymenobacter sp. ASUV-10]MDO7875677.1 hypothetical protein [Hymenobacter sp. ASUV-10]